MKVMNGLLSRKTRFLCVSLFYYVSNFAGAKISIKSCLMRSFFFCLGVFSSSELLGKITSFHSE